MRRITSHMNTCFRCNCDMPEPGITEAVNRELDWRNFLNENPDEDPDDRVLVCIKCADELEEQHELY